MFNPDEIGQLIADEVYDFCLTVQGRKQALIEPAVYDDETGHGYDPLDRWGDCKYDSYKSRWSESGHPMTDWKA